VVSGAPISIPIYVFITGYDGQGNFISSGHNVVSKNLSDIGYSDLWQLVLIPVNNSYVANTVRDETTALSYPNLNYTKMYVNCPLVAPGSTLDNGQAIIQGWYKNAPIFYFNFGPDPGVPIIIWVFVNSSNVEVGQHVVNEIPGNMGYSAFWIVNLVNVPDDYVANTIFSAADIPSDYTSAFPGIIKNCPIISTQPEGTLFNITLCWYQDRQVKYYNFGNRSQYNSPSIASIPIYVFVTALPGNNGSPVKVPGQFNVINFNVNDPGYSDLWQINFVLVDSTYVANSITNTTELFAKYASSLTVGPLVNCPLVPEGSILAGGYGPVYLTQGWYKSTPVYYFDFGADPGIPIPIWVVFDSNGNQVGNNIIDSIPGDDGYSAFWHVWNVSIPPTYLANTLRNASATSVAPYSSRPLIPPTYLNCPVVYVSPETPTTPPSTPSSPSTSPTKLTSPSTSPTKLTSTPSSPSSSSVIVWSVLLSVAAAVSVHM